MTNLDAVNNARMEMAKKMKEAIESNDMEACAAAFSSFAESLQQQVLKEAAAQSAAVDAGILAARGARQLTGEEHNYYARVIDAMRSANPRQALTQLDVVMPKTVIDAVFEDLTNNHPLLDAINFQNTSGMIEMIVNTHEDQLATWSPLCAEIVTELTSGFKKLSMSMNKLSAFIPVCKAMLDLGPVWLDRYVRVILSEAIALGLEEAIINGTGKNQPIGMNRQVGAGVTVTDGVYPIKQTVTLNDFSPASYGSILAGMAKTVNGRSRTVSEVLMIVNPVDYLQKIMPATTIRNTAGQYVNNVLPFPTRIIQSVQMPEERAIIGLGRRYFMGIGTEKSGRIEYSDEYHFLEDERVYLVKLYGHGEPLDNNAFIYADISGLTPASVEVTVKNLNDGGAAAASARTKASA